MNESTAVFAASREVEVLLGDRGEDRALHPDHRADEGVDDHEQRELPEVLP
jgi:hypothetical protein